MDHNSLMKNAALRDVVQRVREVGLHKVAAKLYNVPELNIKSAAEILGERLVTSHLRYEKIAAGLRALDALEISPKQANLKNWFDSARRSGALDVATGGALGAAGGALVADPEERLLGAGVGAGVGSTLGGLKALGRNVSWGTHGKDRARKPTSSKDTPKKEFSETPIVGTPDQPSTIIRPDTPTVITPEPPPTIVRPEAPTLVAPELPPAMQQEAPTLVAPELPPAMQQEAPLQSPFTTTWGSEITNRTPKKPKRKAPAKLEESSSAPPAQTKPRVKRVSQELPEYPWHSTPPARQRNARKPPRNPQERAVRDKEVEEMTRIFMESIK